MQPFLFTPGSVVDLALVIFTSAFLAYLLTIKEKSTAPKWLILSFAGFDLAWVTSFLVDSLSPAVLNIPQMAISINMALMIGLYIAFWAFMMFSYHFLENPFPKETKAVKWITGILMVIGLLDVFLSLFVIAKLNTLYSYLFVYLLFLVFVVLGMITLFRKARFAKKEHRRQERTAYRYYILLYGLLLLYFIGIIYEVSAQTAPIWLGNALGILILCYSFGLAVAYLNYSSEPASFQIKLIGLSLVAVIAVFSFIPVTLFTSNTLKRFYPQNTQHPSLRFRPVSNNGYQITSADAAIDTTDLGMNLHLSNEQVKKEALSFSFPFAGKQWDSLYVSSNGTVTFGKPIFNKKLNYYYRISYIYNAVPKITPFYNDLDPSLRGGVYLKSDSLRAVVTWYKVAVSGMKNIRVTFQAVLAKNGSVTFNYGSITPAEMIAGRRGLSPGGSALLLSRSNTKMPTKLSSNRGWIQFLGLGYRFAIHKIIVNLIWLLLGFSAFILIVFPFFYRRSLVKPLNRLLNGVKQMNRGELETEVAVGVRDEIGQLTINFNRMTNSLRGYRDDLEEKVAERTAELEKSLSDLQAAQTQLVQQEKLASLGQLTAGIAHEIKNPLNFVNNFSEVSMELIEEVREELKSEKQEARSEKTQEGILAILDDIEANLKKIYEHGSRADSIVKSMLQHSRGGSNKAAPTNLNALVKEFVNLSFHGMRAGKHPINVDIDLQLDENVGEITMIAEDFSRVIVNLCNNAFDAMAEKIGRKDLQGFQNLGGLENYQPRLTVRTARKDEQVTIEIEDNGPGIPEEVKEKILQPFFTTKKGTEGTGLGLSITHDIVEAHGGEMAIESSPEEGTRFIIQLTSDKQNANSSG